MAEKGSERRRFQRKEIDTELRYSVLLPSFNKGITKNISQGGLCILINEKLNKGSILRVEFSLPGEEASRIEAVAKAMWQEKQGDKFLTGVQFLT